MDEAKKRGWKTEVINKAGEVFSVTPPGEDPFLFRRAVCEINTGAGFMIATDKSNTYAIGEKLGVPVPKSFLLSDETTIEQAIDFMKEHKPVVVKPPDTDHGIGITINIEDEQKLRDAVDEAKTHTEEEHIIIQEQAKGTDHRVLVVGDKVIAATERLPAYVVGDGAHTVMELIEEKNSDPRRSEDYGTELSKISVEKAKKFLGEKENDIPARGEEVRVVGVSNAGQGGETVDITDDLHPEISKMCVDICQAVGLGVCGVDVFTTDISKPPSETGAVILEINKSPGIRLHHYPDHGKSRNAAGAILDEVLKRRQANRE